MPAKKAKPSEERLSTAEIQRREKLKAQEEYDIWRMNAFLNAVTYGGLALSLFLQYMGNLDGDDGYNPHYRQSFNEYVTTLGVSKNYTRDEVNKAYRKKSILYHPDKKTAGKQNSGERMKKLNTAKDALLERLDRLEI